MPVNMIITEPIFVRVTWDAHPGRELWGCLIDSEVAKDVSLDRDLGTAAFDTSKMLFVRSASAQIMPFCVQPPCLDFAVLFVNQRDIKVDIVSFPDTDPPEVATPPRWVFTPLTTLGADEDRAGGGDLPVFRSVVPARLGVPERVPMSTIMEDFPFEAGTPYAYQRDGSVAFETSSYDNMYKRAISMDSRLWGPEWEQEGAMGGARGSKRRGPPAAEVVEVVDEGEDGDRDGEADAERDARPKKRVVRDPEDEKRAAAQAEEEERARYVALEAAREAARKAALSEWRDHVAPNDKAHHKRVRKYIHSAVHNLLEGQMFSRVGRFRNTAPPYFYMRFVVTSHLQLKDAPHAVKWAYACCADGQYHQWSREHRMLSRCVLDWYARYGYMVVPDTEEVRVPAMLFLPADAITSISQDGALKDQCVSMHAPGYGQPRVPDMATTVAGLNIVRYATRPVPVREPDTPGKPARSDKAERRERRAAAAAAAVAAPTAAVAAPEHLFHFSQLWPPFPNVE
jgi:hypothetical protein